VSSLIIIVAAVVVDVSILWDRFFGEEEGEMGGRRVEVEYIP